MIDRNKPRKRKPRIGHRRNSNPKSFNNQHNNVPKSKVGISKALEKYTSLAQDAYSNGDRIVAKTFTNMLNIIRGFLMNNLVLNQNPLKSALIPKKSLMISQLVLITSSHQEHKGDPINAKVTD